MVKNPDTGQLDTGTMTGSKLTRFKQSLTTGLQQVNDSGSAKFQFVTNFQPTHSAALNVTLCNLCVSSSFQTKPVT